MEFAPSPGKSCKFDTNMVTEFVRDGRNTSPPDAGMPPSQPRELMARMRVRSAELNKPGVGESGFGSSCANTPNAKIATNSAERHNLRNDNFINLLLVQKACRQKRSMKTKSGDNEHAFYMTFSNKMPIIRVCSP